MSDASKTNDATPEKPVSTLTAREEDLFKTAMLHCLKSGAPDIDMQKFVKYGGFNTLKTAQNTWGKIRNKLPKPEVEDGEDGAGTFQIFT